MGYLYIALTIILTVYGQLILKLEDYAKERYAFWFYGNSFLFIKTVPRPVDSFRIFCGLSCVTGLDGYHDQV